MLLVWFVIWVGKDIFQTRMHSSRMHTAPLLTDGDSFTTLLLHGTPLSWHPPFMAPTAEDGTPRVHNDWHTPVKILPCPKLRLRAVNIRYHENGNISIITDRVSHLLWLSMKTSCHLKTVISKWRVEKRQDDTPYTSWGAASPRIV